MKRLIIAVMMTMAVSQSIADEVKIHVPYSPGGAISVFLEIAKKHLTANGLDADIKLMGNCVLPKQQFDAAKTKIITILYRDLNKNPDCALTTTEDNFVGIVQMSMRYVCSLEGKTLDDFRKRGKTYTIGWNSGTDTKKFMDEISEVDGTRFNLLPYKNYGDLMIGVQAKEMDFVFTPGGISKIRENGGECFFGTNISGIEHPTIPNIRKYYPQHSLADMNMVDWMIAKNFTASEMDSLRGLLRKVQQTDEWKRYEKSRDIVGTAVLSVDQQLKVVIGGR